MDAEGKLRILGGSATDDVEAGMVQAPCGLKPRQVSADPGLSWVRLPGGGMMRLMVEIFRVSRGILLRVPGIGPRAAERIIQFRREINFRDLKDLAALGVAAKRARSFITIGGKRQGSDFAIQKELWRDERRGLSAIETDEPPCAYR